MDNQTNKILTDILIAIDNIEKYIGDNRVFDEYDSNYMLQDAVERNLITMGEAVNNLLKKHPKIEITNARRIVDTRNKLTHGYDEIENVQVWNIIIKHLPVLRTEISHLIEV